jgi:hypothetical protein
VAPRNIYLIASSFPKTTLALTQNGQLGDPGKRNTEPPAKSIGKLRPIIIAAAGQEMTGKPAERLSPYYPAGPQNLGDWPTVIVVTACLQCSRNDAQLMKKASFSPTAVHVAAPGGSPVAGWIGPAEVGAAAGTSQAAAYAAGVAAAMIARFPADYAQAENLKAWMQITAWPIVEGIDANDGDAARLATGVIDPLRAQLDPRQSWMLKGDVWTSVRLGNFPVAPLVNSDGQTPQIISAAVRRLVRLAPRDTAPPYALISLGDTISEVVRTGPLTLGDGTIAVCEVGAAGSVGPRKIIELSEIQDLIIALQGVKANDCTA